MEQLQNKNRESEKSRELLPKDKADSSCKDSVVETGSSATSNSGSSKPNSPSISPTSSSTEQKRGPEVTSQGVQTSGPGVKQEKEEKKDTTEWVTDLACPAPVLIQQDLPEFEMSQAEPGCDIVDAFHCGPYVHEDV